MVQLRIYKIDNENDEIVQFNNGEHVFGRGKLLQCDDKRVSRNHGRFIITDEEVTLTAMHINPCFHQSINNAIPVALTKDTTIKIEDGDKFALVPDHYWFKLRLFSEICDTILPSDLNVETVPNNLSAPSNFVVEEESSRGNQILPPWLQNIVVPNKIDSNSSNTFIIKTTENTNEITSSQSSSSIKHKLETDNNEEVRNKKMKKENNEATTENLFTILNDLRVIQTNTVVENVPTTETSVVSDDIIEQDVLNDLTNETVGTAEASTYEMNETLPLVPHTSENSNEEKPDSGTNKDDKSEWRDRCWFGVNCYRKSTAHKQGYSHPGDLDYETDPNDDRPSCSYGGACYRRNKLHRRNFKHPAPNNQPPQPKKKLKRTTKPPVNKKKKPNGNETDSEEDDYDYEDPFIDDSSDEYKAESSDDSDSDYSNDDVEDDGNTKRLLKEAKRFTRGDKK